MLPRSLHTVIVAAILAFAAAAQEREPVDDKAIEVLRQHGLEQSEVMTLLSWICDVHGPRLTGSPNLRRAQKWATETLTSWGLENVHLEPWGPFGRGWRLNRFNDGGRWVTTPWPDSRLAEVVVPESAEGRVIADVVRVE